MSTYAESVPYTIDGIINHLDQFPDFPDVVAAAAVLRAGRAADVITDANRADLVIYLHPTADVTGDGPDVISASPTISAIARRTGNGPLAIIADRIGHSLDVTDDGSIIAFADDGEPLATYGTTPDGPARD